MILMVLFIGPFWIYQRLQQLSTSTFRSVRKGMLIKSFLTCLFIKDGCEYGGCTDDYLWENMTLDVYSDVMFFFSNY